MANYRAAALLLSCVVACAAVPTAHASVHPLPPFTAVTSCVPYNVQIIPGPRYTVAVDADAAVEAALTANVSDGVLYLGSGPFNTSNPIMVNVTLPAANLTGVMQGGGLASIFVGPGFNGSDLTVQAGLGPGNVVVSGVNYTAVNLQNAGTGSLSLAGTFGTVSLTASGITENTISGVLNGVTLTLSGISNVYIVSASPRLVIDGTANGITSVQYNQGICMIPSAFPFSSVCELNPSLAPPVTPVVPWTANLNAVGMFVCTPRGISPSATAGATTTGTAAIQTTVAAPGLATSNAAAGTVAAGMAPSTAATGTVSGPGSATSSAAATGVPPSTATAGAGAVPIMPQQTVAPAPEPEMAAGPSFNFATPTPGGFQSQSGSVTPTGTNANAAAQGTNSASASAVAGPGGASTQTANDGTSNSFNTGG